MHSLVYTDKHLHDWNLLWEALTVDERIDWIFQHFNQPLITSSFGATSVWFLYRLGQVRPGSRVYLINTGYLFEETLSYANTVAEFCRLELAFLNPDPHEHTQTQQQQLWKTNPDSCCFINKLQPLDKLKPHCDIWLTGLQADQTEHRRPLQYFTSTPLILKASPLLDVPHDDVVAYILDAQLPIHPLVSFGYESIGCLHCTLPGEGRSGRWAGFDKTECGLHL
jgi:phosphoadenosine phosphosulfate reductase